jgi:hypothetical protein
MPKITVYGDTNDTTVVATSAISVPSGSTLEPDPDPSAHQVPMQFEDEGLGLGTAGTVNELDFVGAGVTTARVGNKVIVNVPGGGGGGGGGAATVETLIGDLTLTELGPLQPAGNSTIIIPATADGGWAAGAGCCFAEFQFQTTNFFAGNPDAHIPFAVRRYDDVLPKGAGIAMGNLTGAFEGSPITPTVMIEDFNAGTLPAARRYLLADTDTSVQTKIQDGVRYLFRVWSKVSDEGVKTTRYVMFSQAAVSNVDWDLIRDTGDCIVDQNNSLDSTQTGIQVADIFRTPGAAWTIQFIALRVVWGPPSMTASPDLRGSLNNRGDAMTGDLDMSTVNGLNILVKSNTGVDPFASFTAFKAAAVNGPTTVVAVPNGTHSNANFLAANNPGRVNFSMAWFGVGGVGAAARAEVTTAGSGTGLNAVPLDIKIGTTTNFTFFAAGGVQKGFAAGATRDLFGTASARLTGIFNEGGANALPLAQGAQNMEVYCTPGNIAAAVNNGAGLATAAGVELVFRPIAGILSCIIADLRNAKII